jgi:ParB family chromosome partitioning protein
VLVKISSIRIPAGRRDPHNVEQLAQSIEEVGLLNAITVTESHVLIAGRNRLEACRSLGWEEVEVNVVALDKIRAELAEIDENIVRNELTALERSEQMKRGKEIYEALHPETKKGGDRGNQYTGGKDRLSETISFSHDTSAKTGLTARSIQQDVQIATGITEDVKRDIADTPIADSKTDLLKLSRHEPSAQRQIAKAVREGIEKHVPMPPSPKKAREIAIKTGKSVAASNNTYVLPMSEADQRALGNEQKKIRSLYDAIGEIANAGISSSDMAALGKRHFCRDLVKHSRLASTWLAAVAEEGDKLERKKRVS